MRSPKNLARVSLVVGMIMAVFGAATVPAAAQAVTQGYSSTSSLQLGTIVELKGTGNNTVVPLKATDISQMEGVVVAANDTPVTLSTDNPTQQQYFVATAGQFNVLVSDQNGPIKQGDYVTISSIDGVAMKADSSQSVVLGRANAGFTGADAASTAKLGSSKVNIGRISVTIAIARNPLAGSVGSSVPGLLKQAGQAVSSKPVNPVRLYAAFVILLASLIVAASMLYSGIRSSLIAVGRNPLAKQSILRNLFQVVLMSLVVFTIGLIAVYLILKL